MSSFGSKNWGRFISPSSYRLCIVVICLYSLNLGLVDSDKGTKPFAYETAFKTLFCEDPSSAIQYPNNVQEIQQIVKDAVRNGTTVKAIGNLHSINDVACTDGIPISLRNVTDFRFQYNEDKGTIWVGGGVEMQELLEYLEAKGRTLVNVPGFHGITVAGAIATGAHGSSLIHPATISDQAVSFVIIDGNGGIQEITRSEDVAAFKLNLGLLGIVTKVQLRTVPLFKLRMEKYRTDDSILTDGTALELAETYDHVTLSWFPLHKEVIVQRGKMVPIQTPGNDRRIILRDLAKEVSKAMADRVEDLQERKDLKGLLAMEEEWMKSLEERYYADQDGNILNSTSSAVGYAWRLIGNKCTSCFWDQGPDHSLKIQTGTIMTELHNFHQGVWFIKEIMQWEPLPFPTFGLPLRFTKGSHALIDPSRGNDVAHFEWPSVLRTDSYNKSRFGLGAMQAISQILVNQLDGLAHWGKNGLYLTSPALIKKTVPKRDEFIKYMKRYDPHGVFLNKFGRRFLDESKEMDGASQVKHCALLEHCVCSNDDDCGGDQVCVELMEAMICKEKSTIRE